MSGGGAPDTALAILLTMLVAWAGTSIAHRRQTPLAVLTALGTAQLAMHLVLNYVVPSHIGHHAPPVDPAAMLATHAIATLLTGLLLVRADAALSVIASAIRLLTELLKPPTFPVVPTAVYVLPASPRHIDHLLQVVLRKQHARRGPPRSS
jgi:hypothetical protein